MVTTNEFAVAAVFLGIKKSPFETKGLISILGGV